MSAADKGRVAARGRLPRLIRARKWTNPRKGLEIEMKLERINISYNGLTLSVIPTEGGFISGRGKIVGLFMSEEDARSEEADKLAWGTVAWDFLTPEQQLIAARNTESL